MDSNNVQKGLKNYGCRPRESIDRQTYHQELWVSDDTCIIIDDTEYKEYFINHNTPYQDKNVYIVNDMDEAIQVKDCLQYLGLI